MDLEMTGLDPVKDVIVEIATLVTDDQLEIVAEGPDLVIHQPEDVLAAMDPYVVRDAHPRRASSRPSGRRPSPSTRPARHLAFIREHVPEPGKVPLCGNSIGTDRRFLAAYLPEIEQYLHYRSVDVSSVKELVKRLVPRAGRAATAQGRRPPGPRRHPRERQRAALLPRARLRADAAAGGARHRPERVATRRPRHHTGRPNAVSTTERANTTRKNTSKKG